MGQALKNIDPKMLPNLPAEFTEIWWTGYLGGYQLYTILKSGKPVNNVTPFRPSRWCHAIASFLRDWFIADSVGSSGVIMHFRNNYLDFDVAGVLLMQLETQ